MPNFKFNVMRIAAVLATFRLPGTYTAIRAAEGVDAGGRAAIPRLLAGGAIMPVHRPQAGAARLGPCRLAGVRAGHPRATDRPFSDSAHSAATASMPAWLSSGVMIITRAVEPGTPRARGRGRLTVRPVGSPLNGGGQGGRDRRRRARCAVSWWSLRIRAMPGSPGLARNSSIRARTSGDTAG